MQYSYSVIDQPTMKNILGKSADDSGPPGFQHQRAGSFTRRGLSRIFRLPTKRKKE
jgi:hypothetical protein